MDRICSIFSQKGWTILIISTSVPLIQNPDYLYIQAKTFGPSFLKFWQFDRFCKKFKKRNPTYTFFGLERNSSQHFIRSGGGVHKAYLQSRKATDSFWKQLSFKINPLHQILLFIEKKSLKDPSLKKVIVNSHMIKKQYLEHYPILSDKLKVIHNGVEWNELNSSFEESKELKASDIHEFIFIGNGYKRKGLIPLLYSLANISEKFHLTIIGKDKRINFFKKIAKQLGLTNKVSFLGSQKNIIPYLQKAHTLVLPSYYDPFANVTIEALAMGLFVITSAFNGGKEIITEENGIILPKSMDLHEMTNAIKKALKNPKTANFSTQIRNSVRQYDFSNQLKQYIELIENESL
ncbi:MAG TPA: glycosyltransferase [Chlamydiales bacterium]|nr:glycosyltransferase [Chlamydiales bacterium]